MSRADAPRCRTATRGVPPDFGSATSLSDEAGNALAFTTRGGTSTVGTAAVSGPASLGLVLLGAACAAWAGRASRPQPGR